MFSLGEQAVPARRIWLHAASLGDMRAIAPLVERIDADPHLELAVITGWTPHGITLGRRLFGEDRVHRAPLPLRYFTDRFLAQYRPEALILEYLEWYPGWLSACHHKGLPVVIIDGHVGPKTQRIRAVLRRTAHCISGFAAQTPVDAERAIGLGVDPHFVQVCGFGKYDGFNARPPTPSEDLLSAIGQREVVIGCLHPDEENAAIAALADTELRVVIAPRYLKRVPHLVRKLKIRRLSHAQRTAQRPDAQIVILDTLGELAAAYASAPVAIIGGTFGNRQGQTLFEAALHNRVILYGPNHRKIRVEASALAGNGAFEVPTWVDALRKAGRFQRLDTSTSQAISRLRGATQCNLTLIRSVLETSSGH